MGLTQNNRMNKTTTVKNIFAASCILFLAVLFPACTDETSHEGLGERETASVRINLAVPFLNQLKSKAISPEKEAEISYDNLQVLVFEEASSGSVFRYKAEPESSSPPLIVKVPTSASGEKYLFVLLANADEQTIPQGMSKAEAMDMFVFDCLGKWNTSGADPGLIPMWGELETPLVITENATISVDMHRALARIDIGNLFRFNNPDPETGDEYSQKEIEKESVWGLDNFKIREVRVYRTRSQAYVASSGDRISGSEVVTPNIPPSSRYNSDQGIAYATLAEADQSPLIYTLPERQDSYIREIYVPESFHVDGSTKADNVPCLVIGGYYGAENTTKVSYYRADFAKYRNETVESFSPILRNHRYVFDIRSVSGPGFETPGQALKSITSPMKLDVKEWNEVVLDYTTQGSYYLGIGSRDVWLQAVSPDDQAGNIFAVPYKTNLELDGSPSKRFTFSWEKGTDFDVSIDYANKSFIFKARNDNNGIGGQVRSDVLTVGVESMKLTIKVSQNVSTVEYTIDCDGVKVYGQYKENIGLTASNYVTLKATSNVSLDGEAYEFRTDTKNGIYFEAKGRYENGQYINGIYEYQVRLDGYGTLVIPNGDQRFVTFYLSIYSNSVINANCPNSVRIIMAYTPKKILTIGANDGYSYGYMLEPRSASRAMVEASVNFGLDVNSTVYIDKNTSGSAFTIEVIAMGSGMNGNAIDYNYLLDKMNTFKPDIILTGEAINFLVISSDTRVIELVNSFVDEGGVFLMCNGYYPNGSSTTAMVNRIIPGVTGNTLSLNVNSRIFSLPVGEEYADDLILNGPFGDLRGKQWGSDGSDMHDISGLTAENAVVYSTFNGKAIMFRHKTKPFFYIGEGGFISNNMMHIGGTSSNAEYFPFAIDASYRPIPRTTFGVSLNKEVNNSRIFANVLTWAIDYAEKKGIRYPETGKKFPVSQTTGN